MLSSHPSKDHSQHSRGRATVVLATWYVCTKKSEDSGKETVLLGCGMSLPEAVQAVSWVSEQKDGMQTGLCLSLRGQGINLE